MDLLFEDSSYFDLTTLGLEIEELKETMSFAPKEEILLIGCAEVESILERSQLTYKFFKQNGEIIFSNEKILECYGEAKSLHKAWKISQNTFEYMSGITIQISYSLQLEE